MVQLCPLCGSSDQEYVGLGHDTRFGIPEEYQIMKCRSCRHVYTSNPPTPQEMAYLY